LAVTIIVLETPLFGAAAEETSVKPANRRAG
jgi:hypothetical protein